MIQKIEQELNYSQLIVYNLFIKIEKELIRIVITTKGSVNKVIHNLIGCKYMSISFYFTTNVVILFRQYIF